MSTTTSELKFRVTGDAGGAASAFSRMVAPLQRVKKAAAEAKTSLAGIKSTKATVSMDTKAIDRAKTEIKRLRDEIAKKLEADVTADTRPAERRIRQLESSIRTLSRHKITPDIDTGRLAKVKQGLAGIADGVQRFGAGAKQAFSSIGVPVIGALGVAAAGAATGIAALAIKSTMLADDLEGSKIAFTKFLGSAEKADTFLGQLRGFANRTPFEFPELVSAGQRLLGLGLATKSVIPLMRTLGDTAGYTKRPVGDLVDIWSQMVNKGKIANEELLQLSERNIPAYQILAQQLGVSTAKVTELATQGKLGAEALKQLQIGLDKKYGGGMAQLAGTLGGMISTLKDTMAGTLTDIGNAVLPLAKAVFPAVLSGAESLGAKVKGMMPTLVNAIAGGLQGLLKVPGTLLDGLAAASQDIASMVSGIQRQVAGLIVGIADAMNSIPGVGSQIDTTGMRLAAAQMTISANKVDEMGKSGFAKLTAAARSADGALSPIAKKIEDARRAAQGEIRLNAQTQEFDTKMSSVDRKIKQAKHYRADPKLGADKTYWDREVKRLEAEKKRLAAGKALVKLDAKIDGLREKVNASKALLKRLQAQKSTPEIRAKIAELKAKIKQGEGDLARLNRKRAAPEAVLRKAAFDAAHRSATGKVNSLDKKRANPKASMSWSGKTPSSMQSDINRIHGTAVTVRVYRKMAGGGGQKNIPKDLIDPTGFGGLAAAFAAAGRHATTNDNTLGLLSDADITVNAPAPQVQIIVRDKKLADLLDVRIDQRAQQAVHVQQRQQVIHL